MATEVGVGFTVYGEQTMMRPGPAAAHLTHLSLLLSLFFTTHLSVQWVEPRAAAQLGGGADTANSLSIICRLYQDMNLGQLRSQFTLTAALRVSYTTHSGEQHHR